MRWSWGAAMMSLGVAACAACAEVAEPVGARRVALDGATEEKLLAAAGTAGDWLGFSVAIDGDTLVAGAHGDDTRGTDAGAAYVFARGAEGWSMQAKLVASDGGDTDYFGWAVDVSGDTIVVGARRDADRGTDFGSAYVFSRRGDRWVQQQKLYPSDGVATDRFGWSVSVDGRTALIGAVTHDGPAMDSGAAYVFTRTGSTWTEQQKLVASDGTGGDFLGQTVALDGTTALLGADEDNVGGEDSGSAYVFVRTGSTWTEQAKLVASDGAAADFFANGIALDGDTAVIGAWGRDDRGAESGGAYVFVRSGTTWTQQAKLVAPEGAAGDRAGREVALDGNVALVGAYLEDDGGTDAGAVLAFERSGASWTMRSKTVASDASSDAQFGWALAMDGVAVVGAPYDPERAGTAGAVYLYDLRSGGTAPPDGGDDAGIGTPDASATQDGGTEADAGTERDAATDTRTDAAMAPDSRAEADAGTDLDSNLAGGCSVTSPAAAPPWRGTPWVLVAALPALLRRLRRQAPTGARRGRRKCDRANGSGGA